MSEPISETIFHIYPTDCDMLGHLNHASMLGFLERARWALFDHRMSAQELMRQPVFPVVRHVDIGYRAQTLPGEDLAIRSGILRIGNTSYTIRQEARNVRTGELVAEANLVIVAIDRAGKPVAVPESWKTNMPAWPEQP
ncbi:MAG TPA: thioesterase family protein [Gemmatimonadaceae bacterium]|nr:thioesterase family protein [Gemmatimonadaceae bacterium]